MSTKEMIIREARKEFLLYGYNKASLRRIAAKCNITATALYRHFKDKEDMFQSVIEPFISEVRSVCLYVEETDYDLLKNNNVEEVWNFEGENNFHFALLFKGDKELVKLIINERRIWLKEKLTDYEFNSTIKYLNKMKEYGLKINEFDQTAFRVILNSYVDSYFDVLLMDLEDEESFKICKAISDFYRVGFRNLLGF